MKERSIDLLHQIFGVGMNQSTIALLAAEHVESQGRRGRLAPMEHVSFLCNNLAFRLSSSPRSDLGAHFVPSLLLTASGVAIYFAGGKGAMPDTAPSWPVLPLVLGLIWLFVQSCRVGGFPTKGAVVPSMLTAFGTAADATLMPIAHPEDQLIRAGLALFAAAGPAVFILLRFEAPQALSWIAMREALSVERRLRSAWHLLSLSVTLMALGELLAFPRTELAFTVRAGAAIAGVGLAWMAQSFHRVTRWPKAS